MSKRILSALAVAGCGLSMAAQADTAVTPSTTVGSQAFIDFTNISNEKNGVDVAPTGTAFDVKRLYLYVDHQFNDTYSANITTDAQFSSSTTAGSGGVTEVFIKKLYLQGKFDDAFIVRAGAYNSPWTSFVEGMYGYRWVEKVMTDRLGFANTADWGVNAGGKFGTTGLSYSASVVNGAGFKNPSRVKTPDFEARVGYEIQGFVLGVGYYEGHLGQVTVANENNDQNTATRFDAVIGYSGAGFRVGAEYFTAKNYKTVNNITAGVFGTSAVVAPNDTDPVPSDKADGESFWASYAFLERYSVFARYDNAKLSKDVLPDLKDEYFNIGVAYKPIKNVDVGLVYKNEKVDHGTNTVSGADANGSVTIGGTNATNGGKYSEIGLFMQWSY